MGGRQVLLYFAWSHPAESQASLDAIEDRFPAVFELRRLFYPKFERLASPEHVDQGIAGFLDHIQKPNFAAFSELAETLTGHPALVIERIDKAGIETLLDIELVRQVDTIVVISFDSNRTRQLATSSEIDAIRRFLADPDHLIFVCPHHNVGSLVDVAVPVRPEHQLAEYLHHGDRGIPPRQGFGGFARSLLAGLDVPIENNFGLKPASTPDGDPQAADIDRDIDVLGLLRGVESFNSHAHLPQLERIGPAATRMDVLARLPIDATAPPHPFTRDGRWTFDAMLQSRADTFEGKLLVCDTTMFSSTAGGFESLRTMWTNVITRPSAR